MKRLILLATVAAAMSGCFDKKTADEGLKKAIEASVKVDTANNSPDVALKSWWKLKDVGGVVENEICKNNLETASPYFRKLEQLSMEDVRTDRGCTQSPPVFERRITKVEIQSETRSVITAQVINVTPPDVAAVLDTEDKKTKESGEIFQYLLERKNAGDGWKISQVSRYRSYAQSWEPVYAKRQPAKNIYVYDWMQ